MPQEGSVGASAFCHVRISFPQQEFHRQVVERPNALIGKELRAVFPNARTVTADLLPLLQELLDRGMILDENL